MYVYMYIYFSKSLFITMPNYTTSKRDWRSQGYKKSDELKAMDTAVLW